jgi:hypothetical protein
LGVVRFEVRLIFVGVEHLGRVMTQSLVMRGKVPSLFASALRTSARTQKFIDVVGLYLKPTGEGGRAVHGREEPDSGVGQNPTLN